MNRYLINLNSLDLVSFFLILIISNYSQILLEAPHSNDISAK